MLLTILDTSKGDGLCYTKMLIIWTPFSKVWISPVLIEEYIHTYSHLA